MSNAEFFIWKKRQLRGDARTAEQPWVPWRGGLTFTLLSTARIRGHQMILREARCKSKSSFSPSRVFYPWAAVLRKTSKWKFINSECNKMDFIVSRIQMEFDSLAFKLCAGKWRMWKNGVFFNIEKALA